MVRLRQNRLWKDRPKAIAECVTVQPLQVRRDMRLAYCESRRLFGSWRQLRFGIKRVTAVCQTIKRSYLGSYQNATRSYRLYTLERADANSNSSVDLASWKARPLTLPATRKKIDNILNYSRLRVIGQSLAGGRYQLRILSCGVAAGLWVTLRGGQTRQRDSIVLEGVRNRGSQSGRFSDDLANGSETVQSC